MSKSKIKRITMWQDGKCVRLSNDHVCFELAPDARNEKLHPFQRQLLINVDVYDDAFTSFTRNEYQVTEFIRIVFGIRQSTYEEQKIFEIIELMCWEIVIYGHFDYIKYKQLIEMLNEYELVIW